MKNKIQFDHNLQKAQRQHKAERIKHWLTTPIVTDTKCSFCNYQNPKDNFGCNNCGAPLDLSINTNFFGLPEITYKE